MVIFQFAMLVYQRVWFMDVYGRHNELVTIWLFNIAMENDYF